MATTSVAPLSALTLEEHGRTAFIQPRDSDYTENGLSGSLKRTATGDARAHESDSLKQKPDLDKKPQPVEMKQEAEEPSSESDSEADENSAAKVPRISERRQADNLRFSAW